MEHDGMPCTSEIMIRHREKLLLYGGYLRTNLNGGSFPKSILKHQQVELEFLQAPAFAIGLICRGESYAMNSTVLEKRGGIILFLGLWNGPILSWSERKSCDPPMLGGLVVAMTWKKRIDGVFFTTKIGWIDSRACSTLQYNLRRRRRCKLFVDANIRRY